MKRGTELLRRGNEARRETLERLLDLAWQSRLVNPTEGISYALRAVLIADVAFHGEHKQRAAEVRARARGHLGNLLRITGDWNGAEQQLELATAHTHEAGSPAAVTAQIGHFQASLALDRQDFSRSILEAGRASRFYRKAGDFEGIGRCRHHVGVTFWWSGHPERAAAAHERALEDVSEASNVAAILHSLGLALLDSGRLPEAGDAFGLVQGLPHLLGALGPLGEARVRWAYGRLAAAAGSSSAARAYLSSARETFVEQALWLPAALITVDMAAAAMFAGNVLDSRRQCEAAEPFIKQAGYPTEGAALRILREAAAQSAGVRLLTTVSRKAGLEIRPFLRPRHAQPVGVDSATSFRRWRCRKETRQQQGGEEDEKYE